MKEALDILKDQSIVGYMATVDGGKPRVRPWGFMFEESGRLYFCTASTKKAYEQLKETPYVEYSKTTADMVWVRVRGEIVFDEDPAMKALCMETYPELRAIYQGPDNPIFKVFYVVHGEVTLSDMTPNPPRRYSF